MNLHIINAAIDVSIVAIIPRTLGRCSSPPRIRRNADHFANCKTPPSLNRDKKHLSKGPPPSIFQSDNESTYFDLFNSQLF